MGSRKLRCELQFYEQDSAKTHVLRFKDGEPRKHFTVEGQKLTIDFSHGIYTDDVLAFVRDMMCCNSKPDILYLQTISKIQEAIDFMDKRSVLEHGYSNSEEEKNYIPPYE